MKEDVMKNGVESKPADKESKFKKYLRMTLMFIAMGFLVFLFVMAAYRKFGG